MSKIHEISLELELYDDKIRAVAERVIDWYNSDMGCGRWLLLAGPRGVGKTHIAKKVVEAFGQGGVFVSEPGLLERVKASYGRGYHETETEILGKLHRCRLLVLDDLGVSHVKEMDWIQELYWKIFDARLETSLPLLLTTNLEMEALSRRLGERAWSRLMGGLGGEKGLVSMRALADFRTREW